MGRKSSAKAQSQAASAAPPPKNPRRSFGVPIAVAIAALLIVGLLAFSRGGNSPGSAAPQAQPPQAQAVVDPPASAKHGPHRQDNLPPLPFSSEPPARPAAVVSAAYKFAAEHPEVLSYVPCYCGCERSFGHRGNDDCFVTERAANGDVTEWEPHGMT
jgi:Protein of unknown function with PCYCGC motif